MFGVAVCAAAALLWWWLEWYGFGLFHVGVFAFYGLAAQVTRFVLPGRYDIWRNRSHSEYWRSLRLGDDVERIIADTKEALHDYPTVTVGFVLASFAFAYKLLA